MPAPRSTWPSLFMAGTLRFGGWVWRYDLAPAGPSGTRVTLSVPSGSSGQLAGPLGRLGRRVTVVRSAPGGGEDRRSERAGLSISGDGTATAGTSEPELPAQ